MSDPILATPFNVDEEILSPFRAAARLGAADHEFPFIRSTLAKYPTLWIAGYFLTRGEIRKFCHAIERFCSDWPALATSSYLCNSIVAGLYNARRETVSQPQALGILVRNGPDKVRFVVADTDLTSHRTCLVFGGIHRLAELHLVDVCNINVRNDTTMTAVYEGTVPAFGSDLKAALSVHFDNYDVLCLNQDSFLNGEFLRFQSNQGLDAFPVPVARSTPFQCKVDIILPVFNQPGYLPDLFATIATAAPAINHVLVADDGSDQQTQSVISELENHYKNVLKVRVIRSEENIGFVRNVNNAYRRGRCDVAILLNSDVLLPEGWLARMTAPFEDPGVALATPFSTNAANLTIRMPEGADWRFLDVCLSAREPKFPGACTAIGFCMAIRTTAFPPRQGLFDEKYAVGYGDDSDLHFRCLEKGYKSVVVDNLLVHHYGGRSFRVLPNLPQLLVKNRAIFFSRWAERYKTDIAAFNDDPSIKEVISDGNIYTQTLPQRDLDYLFVLPAPDTRHGGIRIIFELAMYLIETGKQVAVFCPSAPNGTEPPYGITPFYSIDNLSRHTRQVSVIIATSCDTVPFCRALADIYSSKLVYFVQGPEMCFSQGLHVRAVERGYSLTDEVICVSEFLQRLLQENVGAKPHYCLLGPDDLVFYPRPLKRDIRKVAVCLNTSAEKGSGIALLLARLLMRRGFSVVVFGALVKEFDLPAEVEALGLLDSDGVARLFSSVGFYLDGSMYEGLGLLPLEAAFCGAIPVVMKHGGTSFIFTEGRDAIYYAGLGDFEMVVNEILRVAADTFQQRSEMCRDLVSKVNLRRYYI